MWELVAITSPLWYSVYARGLITQKHAKFQGGKCSISSLQLSQHETEIIELLM